MKNMTEGEPLKLIIPFMIPLLIGNVFQQLYNIADIIIVGRTIGVNALAAVGATAPLFMMLVILTLGMSGGFSVVTGQLFGAGDLDGVRRSAAMSTMLCTIGAYEHTAGALCGRQKLCYDYCLRPDFYDGL